MEASFSGSWPWLTIIFSASLLYSLISYSRSFFSLESVARMLEMTVVYLSLVVF